MANWRTGSACSSSVSPRTCQCHGCVLAMDGARPEALAASTSASVVSVPAPDRGAPGAPPAALTTSSPRAAPCTPLPSARCAKAGDGLLDGPGGEAADEVLFDGGEQDHDRHDGDQGCGEQLVPVLFVPGDKGVDTHGQRLAGVV